MENQEEEFIQKSFDKFEQKTTIESKHMSNLWRWSVALNGNDEVWKMIGKFYTKIRLVKTKEIDALSIALLYEGKDWLFLREGKMCIVVDNENFDFKAIDSGTNVETNERLTEFTSYIIEPSILELIGNSNEFSLRFTSSKGAIDIPDVNSHLFRTMCRQFYNNVYDSTKFIDSLSESMFNRDLKKNNANTSNTGCFIATAAMGDYNHPVVMDLRLFRDNWLLKRDWGVQFTNWYYTHGPKAANIIEKSTLLRKLTFFAIVKPLQILTKRFK